MRVVGPYLLFVGLVLIGTLAVANNFVNRAVDPKPSVAGHTSAKILKRAEEPPLPQDPNLFDARGSFPPAFRAAMAQAKSDSKNVGRVKVESAQATSQRDISRQRKQRMERMERPQQSPTTNLWADLAY